MSEFHPLHVKSRGVRSRKIKTRWHTNTNKENTFHLFYTNGLIFLSFLTSPYRLLSIKSKERMAREGKIPTVRETNLFAQHTYIHTCYTSITPRTLHFERERNFSTLEYNTVGVHATQYTPLNTEHSGTLSDTSRFPVVFTEASINYFIMLLKKLCLLPNFHEQFNITLRKYMIIRIV